MAAGDESALATLFTQWADRVNTVAFWMLQDHDEAEDVVEETFWQAWRNADQFDARRSSGSTWLMMIARSRALDRLRSQRRRTDWTASASTTSTLREQIAARSSGAPDSGGSKRSAELARALEELPPDQREVVELAFLGGFSHSEIAAKTSQPLGTVKTRIRLAMGKLRERLLSLREALDELP